MTFNTGNNVPSTDPRDLYDNAENFDKLLNGADPFYADRKGVLRQSFAGMENDFDTSQEGRENAFTLSQADKESRFQAFLVSSGYVSKGDYAAGVVLEERNEYVAVSAATTGTTAGLYRPGPGATLPLTLTGTWATDSANLVLLGDDVLRQELAGPAGSKLVGHAGSTVFQLLDGQSVARPVAFGAIADGVADDTAAIQAALDDSLYVDFGDRGHHYLVNGSLQLRSGHVIRGQFAIVEQTALQTKLFVADELEDVSVQGLEMRGLRESPYLNSPSSQAIAISASGASRIDVTGNLFRDFCYSPLSTVPTAATSVNFSFNVVYGPGAGILNNIEHRNTTGFTLIGTDITVIGNRITATAQGGIVGQGSQQVVVKGNIIHDLINEHGFYCDTGVKNVSITGNVIRNTGAHGTGIKVQCYDSFGVTPENIEISGNSITNSGSDSILVINITEGTPTIRTHNVTITGNSILSSGQSGIGLRSVMGATVSGNTIQGTLYDGIFLADCNDASITANQVMDSDTCGIFDGGGSGLLIHGNRISNCGRGSTASANCAIFVNTGSKKTISGNRIDAGSPAQAFGVYIADGDQSTMTVSGNAVFDSTSGAFRFKLPAEPLAYFGENVFDGGVGGLFEELQRGSLPHRYFGSAAPTTGTWTQGVRVENLYPSPGGVLGWVCVSGGTPGGWRSYGSVSA